MTDDISILVKMEWKQVDSDGSKCIQCGEQIFLTQFQAVISFTNLPESEWPIEGLTVCQSCRG